jgi:sugar phosphate isomerase/epimerase
MTGRREVALEHLTLLDVAPPDLVSLAAAAGFGAVSLRVSPATDGEQPWPVSPGSRMLADTVRRLDDTGLRVLGAEAIRLDGGRGDWEPVLATAAQLGARYLNAISEDRDLTRLADRFAELTQLALRYGVRPVIEFMSYKPVHTLAAALNIAALSADGRVLVDALHVQRCGVSLADLAAADPARLSYVQLCDAPREPRTGLPPPRALPRGQPVSGGDLALEARARRLLPGQGELPLAGLLGALPSTIPVGVEAPSLRLSRELTGQQFAARARAAADRVLALAAAPGQQTASPGQQPGSPGQQTTAPGQQTGSPGQQTAH